MSGRYEALLEQAKTLSELSQLYKTIKYGHNYVLVKRDNDLISANFKDLQEFTLLSPAFRNPSTVPLRFLDGTAGPTDDSTLHCFLQSTASRNNWLTYYPDCLQTEENQNIPYVYLSTSEQRTSVFAHSTSKLKVWLQGGVHGNEPAGEQCLLALVGQMEANQCWTKFILSKLDILILPRYNPEGAARFQRTTSSNLDLNRDHIKLSCQLTRDIKQLFNSFAPHVAADMHEYSSSKKYAGTFLHASDALFAAAKNLNINEDIRKISENLFATNIGTALEAAGLRWGPYSTGSSDSTLEPSIQLKEAGSDGKIGRNAMGLTQIISFVCETRGITLADQNFQRRTATGLVMVESIVQTAADHADELFRVLTNDNRSFIESNEDVVVIDSTVETIRMFQMVNLNNGKIENVPVRYGSVNTRTANLKRARPEAYLIPLKWSHIARRLELLGLEVTIMSQVFRSPAEALMIVSVTFGNTYEEGIVPVQVATSTIKKEIELPCGSFAVSTRQRNAALAFVALEPENVDSYVASNIIPVVQGEEYPVYRLIASCD